MPRPYKHHTNQQLAELLAAHSANRLLLEALRVELSHRRRPGAVKLAEAVDEARTRLSPTPAPIAASPARGVRFTSCEKAA